MNKVKEMESLKEIKKLNELFPVDIDIPPNFELPSSISDSDLEESVNKSQENSRSNESIELKIKKQKKPPELEAEKVQDMFLNNNEKQYIKNNKLWNRKFDKNNTHSQINEYRRKEAELEKEKSCSQSYNSYSDIELNIKTTNKGKFSLPK